MHAPSRSPIQLRLVSGRSVQPTVPLEIGTKPLAVGTRGDWAIEAEGVGLVHLFVVYDGTYVYVTRSSATHTVLLGGIPIGEGWTVAAIPSELRFAGAHVVLERVATSVLPAAPSVLASTPILAAPLAVSRSSAPPAGLVPQAGLGPQAPSLTIEVPAAMVPGSRPPHGGTSTLSDGGALFDAARRALRDIEGEAAVPTPALVPAPRPSAAPAPNARPVSNPPTMGFNEQHLMATVSMARSPLAPLSPGGSQPPIVTTSTGIAVQPPTTFAAIEPQGPRPRMPSQPQAGGSGSLVTAWREASGVKKISLVLMPFALAASYVLFFAPAPPARRTAPRPAPSAAAAAATKSKDAPTGPAVIPAPPPAMAQAPADSLAAQPPPELQARRDDATSELAPIASSVPLHPSATSQLKTAPAAKAGTRTAERAALDAAASGAFADAARAYDDLAAAHPENPSYREAARILRAKAAKTR